MPASRPNILVFMTDQEQAFPSRPDHPCRMPNAERVARDGILFTNAFCPTAHCCPSRATFMSGVYPSRHGIFNNVCTPTAIHFGLFPGVRLFSEDLKEAGYRLALAGKWHVSNKEGPSDRGWEELLVTANKGVSDKRIEKFRELARKPSRTTPRERGEILRPGWGDLKLYGSYPTDTPEPYMACPDYRIVKSAIDTLPDLAESGKPWFLFVGPNGPHDPFIVPEHYAKMYDPADVPLPPNFHDSLEDKPRVYQRMRRQYWGQLTEDEVRESIAHYWGYCTMMDDLFGLVLQALEETGQSDDTLVIRMADHGEYCGAHGLYMKGVPSFREAYNVPLAMRWPKGISRPGRVVDEFILHCDFAPTFLDLAGVPGRQDFSGRSLLPFLHEQPADWRDMFFSQFNGVELYYTQRIVMTKAWKYVYNGFDFDELYDLRNDPHELVNLADNPAYEKVKREMVARMWRQAVAERDELIFNSYGTVALAPYGPLEGLRDV